MTSRVSYVRSTLLAFSVALLLGLAGLQSAHAATMALSAEQPPSRYFELLAKVEYLKAFIAAIQEGEESPGPTFVVVQAGDTVSLQGTVARTPDPDRMETCGPMVKGEVDWGDGIKESIHGLGCSGDAHTFTLHHRYTTSDSYKIRITDGEDRDTTHVVAIRVKSTADAGEFSLNQKGAAVTVSGELALDEAIASGCAGTLTGVVVWGDGSSEAITCTTDFAASHTYATPGTYKLYVRDVDGDMTQRVVTIK